MMATFEKRTTDNGRVTFRARVRLRGCPPASRSFDRLTDARRWAAAVEVDARRGKYLPDAESRRHTLAEAIDRYLVQVLPSKAVNSQRCQGSQFAWWRERLGHLTLDRVTPAVVAEARDQLAAGLTRSGTPRGPSTTIRYMAALSHLFSVAFKEWQWVESNPLVRVSKPREPRGRVRFLSDDERGRLLEACRESRNPILYDVVVLALSTGMRRNEIMTLHWPAVDLGRRMVTLHDTKNRESRSVPLAGIAFDLIEARARVRRLDTDYCFPAPYRHGQEPKPFCFEGAWQTALARAEIPDFRFHDLRHSAASYLLMSHASLGELAEILGHRTLAMVKRYSHISQPHATKLVERMVAGIFGGQTEREHEGI